MSVAFFIVLDNEDPGFDSMVDGKLIAKESDALSRIAKTIGLKPPEDYISMDGQDLKDLADDLDEEELKIPETAWYTADEGIRWTSTLRKHLEANPTAVKRSAEIVEQLSEFESVFKKANAIGARWHLEVDF